jgi:hypothetical protein
VLLARLDSALLSVTPNDALFVREKGSEDRHEILKFREVKARQSPEIAEKKKTQLNTFAVSPDE